MTDATAPTAGAPTAGAPTAGVPSAGAPADAVHVPATSGPAGSSSAVPTTQDAVAGSFALVEDVAVAAADRAAGRGEVVGVLLMTYGSAKDRADMKDYLTRVRGGREPSAELVTEFERRFDLIGGSPLVAITEALAANVGDALGAGYEVRAGMRFSRPTIAGAAADVVAAGATRLVGVIISPQYSPILMSGYDTALGAAAEQLGVPYTLVGSWHREPAFIEVLASRIRRALAEHPAADRVPVLMTAHSLPLSVVRREPDYIEQLKETAALVAAAAGLPEGRWRFCYQSAGHTPEEWLKPDMLEVLPELAAEGHDAVLVAPVQFLADHLETLYDVDLGGREQADDAGIRWFARVPAPNADRDLAEALAAVVRGAGADDAARVAA